ncbi:hypothetical protein [uncultured Maribacter sp.]|uniref:hypothetical protein n=1 Tax=uncultured Maribacter sp. TaxID=431308 RepID=UPI0026307B66|nr:hypothetical protein [uncultured Maribacter sp.]
MSKIKLDKLFQEKFKGFQELPDEKVWQSIEASLNEKEKKRRAIPLWWKLGGVAAIIALGFFLMNPFSNKQTIPSSVVTETSNSNKDKNNAQEKENNLILKEEINTTTKIAETPSNTTSKEENGITTVSKNNILKNNGNSNTNKHITNAFVNRKKPTSKDNLIAETKKEKEASSIIETKNINNLAEVNTAKKDLNTSTNNRQETIITEETKEDELASEEKETKKSIFEEIKEQEEEKEALANKTPTKRWSAGPNVAPVYFNALGDGSPVDAMFVSNSKSGSTNLSYGLSVAYEVNKKLSIRSGVHKVDYSYNTNNVLFSSNFNSAISRINTISYNTSSSSLEVLSTDTNSTPRSSPKESFALDASAKSPAKEGSMSQQFGYIEVPLELNYTILDTKFGINFIGGLSSLFLIDNSILLSSQDITTELGEANNINSVNFSTNIGVGLNYKFSPKVKINVEPMFKYQLNTFSNTQGTFNPYSIGVYSGLIFKF